ncbi:PAS domain S-box protein [Elioraea rosea]|uniref:PAS domain S-box protein n=1 Tax=Elioraea rosea TaxID=2492390 RepID=UPI0013150D5F|nr:PAS domain S-box protein [Elioraea rosea]
MTSLAEAFFAFARLERAPMLLLDRAGRVLARNEAARRTIAAGEETVLAALPAARFLDFLRDAASAADPIPGRFAFPVSAAETVDLRCEAGACRFGEGERAILLRLLTGDRDQRGFAELKRQVSALNAEMHGRRESEERLRLVIETMRDGVVMFDSEGVIALANPAAAAMFGVAPGAFVGRTVLSLTPIAAQTELSEPALKAMWLPRSAPAGRETAVAVREDGTSFPLELAVQRSTSGRHEVFVAILRDVGQQLLLQEQLAQAQKMEAIGQLAGGIAHDFNNLLTVIIGGAESLLDGLASDTTARDAVRSILSAAQHGSELSRALLAFARRQPLKPAMFDCASRIVAMRDLLRRALRADIALQIGHGQHPLMVRADAAQLDAAILNLAINAQDAMSRGGALNISADAVALGEEEATAIGVAPGPYVRIAVADTGSGIPAELLGQVRQPFFTTKGLGRGTGLGLAQVDGYAAQSGGGMAILSEEGAGTTVELYLPFLAAAEIAEAVAAGPESDLEPPAPASVLIVEDDPMVRRVAVRILSGLDCTVHVAENGASAKLLLDGDERIDLVFTDMVLPGSLSGIDVVLHATARRPGILCAIASGYAGTALSDQGELPAEVTFVPKPYRKADLVRLVATVKARLLAE